MSLLLAAVAPPASARSDGLARLQLTWPADGTVTGRYGEWRGGRRHEGLDIGMLRSLEVRAVAGAVVREAGYTAGYDGYGNVVVLDLPGRYRAVYAHLAEVGVRVGQRVRPAQRVGLAGCTGSCSGTHLHLEIRRGASRVNPLRFLG